MSVLAARAVSDERVGCAMSVNNLKDNKVDNFKGDTRLSVVI